MCHLSQTKRKNARAADGRLATSTPQDLPSLYICGVGCLWTLVHNHQTYNTRSAREQAVGYNHLLCELQGSAHQSHRLDGYFKLHQHPTSVLCNKRTYQTTVIRFQHQFHRSTQGTSQKPTRRSTWTNMDVLENSIPHNHHTWVVHGNGWLGWQEEY